MHCTATKEGRVTTIDEVRQWHKARGWRDIGYHYLIYLNGQVVKGRPEQEVGAHAQGYNRQSIGVCYVGGLDSQGKPKDTRTDAQKASLVGLLKELRKRYPDAKIVGHHDLNKGKACPCFGAKEEYKEL